MPISKIGTGAIILLIEQVLRLLGFEFPEGSVESVANAIAVVIGFALIIFGQLGRKDLVAGIVRKE